MNKLHCSHGNAHPIIPLSPDGYIRLSLKKLCSLHFLHLASDLDESLLYELNQQAVPAETAGFSEWISDTNPAISVGWGWFVHSDSHRLLLAPDAIRSNVMLLDIFGYDLGPLTTSKLFSIWLNTHDWQPSALSRIEFASSCQC